MRHKLLALYQRMHCRTRNWSSALLHPKGQVDLFVSGTIYLKRMTEVVDLGYVPRCPQENLAQNFLSGLISRSLQQ